MRAVIFDCFGVLTTDGWKQLREEFFARDEKLMERALDIDKAVNVGFMDYDEFIKEVSVLSGLAPDAVRGRMDASVPNKLLFEYIRDHLKPQYKIGMLSNAAADWLDELFESWQVSLFDEVALSYAIGAVKPEPAAYHVVADRLGVSPQECVFVDDIERYCEAAEQLGMRAVWHQDTNETIRKLQELTHA